MTHLLETFVFAAETKNTSNGKPFFSHFTNKREKNFKRFMKTEYKRESLVTEHTTVK